MLSRLLGPALKTAQDLFNLAKQYKGSLGLWVKTFLGYPIVLIIARGGVSSIGETLLLTLQTLAVVLRLQCYPAPC